MAMVAEEMVVLYPDAYKPEPSIFTCGTCKSVYSSSWFLVQHVQKSHGIKIYEEAAATRDSSTPNHHHQTSSQPRPIVVQPDKHLLAEQLRKEPKRHPSPPSSTSPARHGCGDVFSFPTPFIPGAPRQPLTSPWPGYGRSATAAVTAEYMMHPEIMLEQFRRMMSDPHAMQPHGFIRPQASIDSQYSERLRLLAATGCTLTSPAKRAALNSGLPFVSSTPPSAFSTPSSIGTTTSSSPAAPKTKACEFCGKQFRFTSNLVLHRRLHTGEKPYACPVCAFNSSQATKLKQHMRTHVSTTAAAAAAVSSPAPAQDSDIEDTEEFVQREAEAEAEIRELQKEAAATKAATVNITTAPAAIDAADVAEDVADDADGEESAAVPADEPTDLSRSSSRRSESSCSPELDERTSLLSEVMLNTGLSSLPNYKEAFTAALAEVPGAHTTSPSSPVKDDPDAPVDKDSADSAKDTVTTDGGCDAITENGSLGGCDDDSCPRRSPPSHVSSDYSSEPPEKRIKREGSPPSSSSGGSPATFPPPPHHGVDPLYHRAALDVAQGLYSGLWFPPSTAAGRADLAAAFSPFLPTTTTAAAGQRLSIADNGLASALSTSAFKLGSGGGRSSGGRGGSSGASHLGTSPPTTPTGRRRNDTCEFCGKIFKNCSNLTVHRRSHTGEKPYKCALCSYACAQSSKLTRHMRTHGRHGKDVYRCKFCCMPFSVASTLEKHMRKCVENQQRAAAAAAALSPRAALPTSPLAASTTG